MRGVGPDSTSWSSGPRIINADLPGAYLDFDLSLALDKLAMGCGNPGDAEADANALRAHQALGDTSPPTPALQAEISDARVYSRVLSAKAIAFLATH